MSDGPGDKSGPALVTVKAHGQTESVDGSPRLSEKKKQEEQLPPKAVATGYFKLYSSADKLDHLLIAIGILGGVGSGVFLPLFSIVFGEWTSAFGRFWPACLGPSPLVGLMTTEEFNRIISGVALKFLYLGIGALVAGFLQQAAWTYTSVRQTNRLRRLYLRAIMRQDIAFFDTQATTGGLLQGLNEDSMAVKEAISEKVGVFLQHLTTFVVGFIVAFIKGWDMTLVLVGCLPFLAGVGAIMAKMSTTVATKQTAAYTEAGTVVQQSLSQIRTVAAYNGEEAAYKQYEHKLDVPQKVGSQQGAIVGLSLGGMQFIMFCSYAVALFYGSVRVSQGYMTGGDVVNVLFAALMGSFSLGMASPNLQYFSKGAVAGSRMFSVINRKPTIDSECDGAEPSSVEGRLRLAGVSFAYPARKDVVVLKNLTLDVPAGKTVALVGSSGSGKSTIVGLIERFYDPLEGTVLLDGVDIKSLKLEWLRQQVGLVSQEPTLFATSIYENIAQGKPGATEQEVHDAARAANAHRFISALPAGYHTQVGERGVQLSGGQKQRIAIARAILKNPKILLLDEATSALDSESEAIVQDALDRMIMGRTTVVVAHRLSTIQNADLIVVMQNGVVAEMGSHHELLANSTGAYTNLVKLQMQQQSTKVARHAEVEEVLASDGKPVTKDDIDHVVSRRRSLELSNENVQAVGHSGQASRHSLEEVLAAETAEVRNRVTKDLEVVVDPSSASNGQQQPATSVKGHAGALSTELAVVPVKRRGWFGKKKGATASESKESRGSKESEDRNSKPAEVKVPFKRLLALNRPEWPYLLLGAVASCIVGGTQPAFAFVISSMTSNFFTPDPAQLRSSASFYAWMFFAIACGVLIATSFQQWSFGVAGQALSRRVRLMLFRSMLRQEIGWFDMDENSSGKLGGALAEDAAVVRGAVGDTFGVVAQNLSVMAVGYVIAFIFNWRMALVVTGIAPLAAVGGFLHMKMAIAVSGTSDKLYANANQAVAEAVSSIRVIQAYNLQGEVSGAYAKLLHGANVTNRKTALIGGVSMAYSQFIMFSLYSLITWFGGLEMASCRSTFDEFMKAFFCVLFAAMGLAQAQMSFPDIAKAKGALQRVFPIVDRKPAIDSSSEEGQAPDSRTVRGELELRHVVFAYPNRPQVQVFNNFCLSIPAGQTVALVGESGSGKSTVVGLIERFYDPQEGQVLLDGVDIKNYNVKWLRQQIGLVSQEPLLFGGSILDNILYGRPDATLAEVEAAARSANAHDFISALPEGYNTQVGERGVQLSGGQKQRVAIARAVVKDPKILLLDEATSALDAASERLVQDALDRIMAGRTSVVVAHRLSTIRHANCIAVVYKGMILEQGTHEELLAIPGGGYARLVAAQMKGGRDTPIR